MILVVINCLSWLDTYLFLNVEWTLSSSLFSINALFCGCWEKSITLLDLFSSKERKDETTFVFPCWKLILSLSPRLNCRTCFSGAMPKWIGNDDLSSTLSVLLLDCFINFSCLLPPTKMINYYFINIHILIHSYLIKYLSHRISQIHIYYTNWCFYLIARILVCTLWLMLMNVMHALSIKSYKNKVPFFPFYAK